MAYQVRIITELKQLMDCDTIQINHYQWTKGNKPKAYGKMALLFDYGLVISMSAIESNPLRTFTMDDDPVYKDSGLEAFLNFDPDKTKQRYLNFEMNANGALLSQFGTSISRKNLASITSIKASCEATVETSSWSVLLKIPMELICRVYSIKPLQQGDVFTYNFYKICESPGFEHYASHAPIKSNVPNFHLPEFFVQAIIVD